MDTIRTGTIFYHGDNKFPSLAERSYFYVTDDWGDAKQYARDVCDEDGGKPIIVKCVVIKDISIPSDDEIIDYAIENGIIDEGDYENMIEACELNDMTETDLYDELTEMAEYYDAMPNVGYGANEYILSPRAFNKIRIEKENDLQENNNKTNENRNMKQTIRLSESDLKNIIKKSIKTLIKEDRLNRSLDDFDDYVTNKWREENRKPSYQQDDRWWEKYKQLDKAHRVHNLRHGEFQTAEYNGKEYTIDDELPSDANVKIGIRFGGNLFYNQAYPRPGQSLRDYIESIDFPIENLAEWWIEGDELDESIRRAIRKLLR